MAPTSISFLQSVSYRSKLGPSIRPQVLGGAIIEIGVEFVNDAAIFLNGKEANLVGFLAGAVENVTHQDKGQRVGNQTDRRPVVTTAGLADGASAIRSGSRHANEWTMDQSAISLSQSPRSW